MSFKFYGALKELKSIIKETGLYYDHLDASPKKVVFHFNTRAVLNWWPSTGTISFQGPSGPKQKLNELISPHFFTD